jgi:hypothetical protein
MTASDELHRQSSKRDRLAMCVFGVLLLVHCIPLWAFTLFPSQDGPSHVYNAAALVSLFFNSDSPLHTYYCINHNFDPNWTSQLFMAAFTPAIGAVSAEKLFLTFYVVSLPVSMWYCLTASPLVARRLPELNSRKSRPLYSLLVFPFLYGYTLHMGFYNFNFSLGVFLVCIGFYARFADKMTSANTLILCLLVLLLYFSHPVSLIAAVLGLGAMAFWRAVMSLEIGENGAVKGRVRPLLSGLCESLWPLVLAFLPAMLLLAEYLVRSHDGEGLSAPSEVHHGFITRGLRLFSLTTLVSFSPVEFLFSCSLVLIFSVLVGAALWERRGDRRLCWGDGFLFMAGGFLVLFFIAPDELAGGSVMEPRLEIFPYFALILWIGSNSLPKFGNGLAVTGAIFCSLGFLVTHVTSYSRFQSYLSEYATVGDEIKAHSSLLVLDPGKKQPGLGVTSEIFRVDPLRHAGSHIALRSNAILLTNYEAAHSYFPVQFRPTHNPYHQIGPFHRDPMNATLVDDDPGRVVDVDYVVTCGIQNNEIDLAASSSLRDQLDSHFELLRTSVPLGLVRVYRRLPGPIDP